MAQSVNEAFNTFLFNDVNLAKERTEKARNSRDAIIDKINNLDDFFPLYKSKHLHFGSFARRTKIRPIDDIDIMICLSIEGKVQTSYDSYKIVVTDISNSCVKECCDDKGYYYTDRYILNSSKVKNKLKTKLSELHDCRKAEMHSNKEAVTLQYSTYEWNFDIVPCVFVNDNADGYYLIPNGSGAWKKTDPRKDRDKVTDENTRLSGNVLELIRLAKYWAKENLGTYVSSYLVETMVIEYCSDKSKLSDCSDWRFEDLLGYLRNAPYNPVYDMKGIQGNINNMSYEQKVRFSNTAKADYQNAQEAHSAEMTEKNQEKAIKCWGKVFGEDFPKYEKR